MTTAPEGTLAMRLENVKIRLGSKTFHFDCRLPEGRITAVTGPSGSGKSTLLNLVAGFEQPFSGRVEIFGEDMSHRHPAERPVSFVFQDNNLFVHLNVLTNLGLGIDPSLRLTAEDRDAISAALEKVGLKGFEQRLPSTLSGGERQRAAFARVLVRKRPILLLDEPFAALDPGLRGEMADLLVSLHRELGNTVLIVSHDPQEVRALADHALFIDDGRVALSAPTGVFFEYRELPGLNRFLKRAGSG